MSTSQSIHACAAIFNNKAVLIIGAPASGKSSLLIKLLAKGFTLIADDLVLLSPKDQQIWAEAPPNANRRFEMRGIGIFQAKSASEGAVHLVIDLDCKPKERLAERDNFEIFGENVTKINGKGIKNIAEITYLLFSEQVSQVSSP